MVNCLAVIPCRGGSKGIHRKNLREIGGIPLVAHTINAANAATLITRTIVSTDDEEIAIVAKKYGGNVPFIRPSEFASDESKSIDVAMHALRTCAQNGEHYDIFVLLQLVLLIPIDLFQRRLNKLLYLLPLIFHLEDFAQTHHQLIFDPKLYLYFDYF